MSSRKPIEEKASVQFQTHLPLDLARRFEDVMNDLGLSGSAAFRQAISEWVERQQQQRGEVS